MNFGWRALVYCMTAFLIGSGLMVLLSSSCARSAPEPVERASAILRSRDGRILGRASFAQDSLTEVTVDLSTTDLPPGPHGLHVHAVGSCEPVDTNAFGAAGGHFNPLNRSHGLQNADGPHAGDLPNLAVGPNGQGHLQATTSRFSLTPGAISLFDADGAAIVVHSGPDDQMTNPSGNSGGRIACGVVMKQ